MRIDLRRPFAPQNAAAEIARLLARALARDAALNAASGVSLTLEDPIERAALRACIQEVQFARQLHWHLQELRRPAPIPGAIHVKYALGDACALVVEACTAQARAARLEWETGTFEI